VPDEHRVAGHLGVAADEYDRAIRTFIPRYDTMLGTIVHWLEASIPEDGLVVDLGAGTGALSAAILDALPAMRVQLVDIDPNMLEAAAARCEEHEGRFELRRALFQDELPPCNAVVTSPTRTRSVTCTPRSGLHSSPVGWSSSATC
jgi:methylase of polypeptide subunit release factors